MYGPINAGQRLIYFVIPENDLFRLIRVTPIGGEPFYLNWWNSPKAAIGDVIIRYYGICDYWLADTNQQSFVIQLRIENNGTSDLLIGSENFTLLDKMGNVYYPVAGFEHTIITPKTAIDRVNVGFTGVPQLRTITTIAYDYGMPNQIIFDLEKDQRQLSDVQVYGT